MTSSVEYAREAEHESKAGKAESMILPNTGFLRLNRVLEFIPVSASTWWKWVKSGHAPASRSLSKTVTVWRVEDIRELIDKINAGEFRPDEPVKQEPQG